jgi:hypothetical protein
MVDNFQQNIQTWVSVDNRIKNLNLEIKSLRNNRSELTNSIFTYAETNNLENAVIQISDGKLKFNNIKQTSPLTFKLVEEVLLECFKDEALTKKIIQKIKLKRDIKYVSDIKRTYN